MAEVPAKKPAKLSFAPLVQKIFDAVEVRLIEERRMTVKDCQTLHDQLMRRINAMDKGQPDALFKATAVRRLVEFKQALLSYATAFSHQRAKLISGELPDVLREVLD